MQEFQEEIAPIKDDVAHMNQLASTFGPHDIQLSPANLDRIDDLNTRWRLLQVHTVTADGSLLRLIIYSEVFQCKILMVAFISILHLKATVVLAPHNQERAFQVNFSLRQSDTSDGRDPWAEMDAAVTAADGRSLWS